MFSYAGVDLGDPDGTEIGEWIVDNIHPQQLYPLAYQTWPAFWRNGPVMNITPEIPRPVKISSLFWPFTASRFAQGNFVVTTTMLNSIRTAAYRYGAAQACEFIFDDGDNSLTTYLWMLPATPIQQALPGSDMWLLTLVDDRYYWWGQSVNLDVTEGITTWNDLYETIGDYLGITIDVDPVASDYGVPLSAYTTGSRPLPLILDAIAFSVGQRIVRGFDGSVTAQNATTALSLVSANLVAAPTDYAGGEFDL